MSKTKSILMDNTVFAYIGAATLVLLAVPALLMLFQIPLLDPGDGYEIINWGIEDFMAMGALIFGMGSLFVIAARKIKTNRAFLAIGFTILFLLIWIELAVDGVSKLIGFN